MASLHGRTVITHRALDGVDAMPRMSSTYGAGVGPDILAEHNAATAST